MDDDGRHALPGQREASTQLQEFVQRHLSPGVIDVNKAQQRHDRPAWIARRSSVISRLLSRNGPSDAAVADGGRLEFSGAKRGDHDAPPVVACGSPASPEPGRAGYASHPAAAYAAGPGPESAAEQNKEHFDGPDQSTGLRDGTERLSPRQDEAQGALSRSLQRLVRRSESAGAVDTMQLLQRYERTTRGTAQRSSLISRLQSRWTHEDDGVPRHAGSSIAASNDLAGNPAPCGQQAREPNGAPESLPLPAAPAFGGDINRTSTERRHHMPYHPAGQEANVGQVPAQAAAVGETAGKVQSVDAPERSSFVRAAMGPFRLNRKKAAPAVSESCDAATVADPGADTLQSGESPDTRKKAGNSDMPIKTAALPLLSTRDISNPSGSGGRDGQNNKQVPAQAAAVGETAGKVQSDDAPERSSFVRSATGPFRLGRKKAAPAVSERHAAAPVAIPGADALRSGADSDTGNDAGHGGLPITTAEPPPLTRRDSSSPSVHRQTTGRSADPSMTGNKIEGQRIGAPTAGTGAPALFGPGVDGPGPPVIHRAAARGQNNKAAFEQHTLSDDDRGSSPPGAALTVRQPMVETERFGRSSSSHGRAGATTSLDPSPHRSPASGGVPPLVLRRRPNAPEEGAADRRNAFAAGFTENADHPGVAAELRTETNSARNPAFVWRTSDQQPTASAAGLAALQKSGTGQAGMTTLSRQAAGAAAESTGATEGSPQPGTTADLAGAFDLELLAEEVSRLLYRRLETERERRGAGS